MVTGSYFLRMHGTAVPWELQNIYHLNGIENVEYILVDKSLIPLEKYYITQFSKWTKYLVRCKICGRFFLVDSRKNKLCGQECRYQVRKIMLAQQKDDKDTAYIDRIVANARAYWYNRLTRIKSPKEWFKGDVEKYEAEKDRFLKDCAQKRKAHKNGEITFDELREWLLHQEVRVQEELESLMGTKR